MCFERELKETAAKWESVSVEEKLKEQRGTATKSLKMRPDKSYVLFQTGVWSMPLSGFSATSQVAPPMMSSF